MRPRPLLLAALVATGVVLPGCSPREDKTVVIGAKKFTESVILAEIATQLARHGGATARRDDLGGGPAVWLALIQGEGGR